MSQLVIRVPDKNTPGFPRRLQRAAAFKHQIEDKGFTPDLVEKIVEFLSDYVEGGNKAEQIEMIWNCTEVQFDEMLSALGGGGQQVPPPKPEALDTP